MITEDYVSFETAKLLKEKGFDECTISSFDKDGNPKDILRPFIESDGDVRKPTLQRAIKWLRKTFGIHCQIDCPIDASNWVYGIRDLNKDEWITLRNMGDYDTYEEACEAAIKYCLENLI